MGSNCGELGRDNKAKPETGTPEMGDLGHILHKAFRLPEQ